MATARKRSRKKSHSSELPGGAPARTPGPGRLKLLRRVALGTVLVTLAAGALYLARGPVARLGAALHYARAGKLVRDRQNDLARAEFRSALALQPGHRAARRDLAALELELGHVEQAFLQFQAWTEMQPDDAEGWLGLARLRLLAGQPEEADAAAGATLEIVPDDAAARALRAEIRYRGGRYRGALLDAQRAVQRDPKSSTGWLLLSKVTARIRGAAAGAEVARRGLAAAGEAPGLREQLRDAPGILDPPLAIPKPEARPDSAEQWPGALGTMMREFVIHTRRGEWASAQAQASQARTTYPSTMLGPWLEGLTALGQGKLEVAEGDFHEALQLSPRSHRVITNLAALWSRQGGPADSGNRLVRLAEHDAGFDYPLTIAAHAYLEAGQPALAEATVRRELERRRDSAVPYRDLAQLFLDLDRASDALLVCDDGLGRFPADARLQLQRARGSALLGDREAAIRSYETVLLSRPDDDQTTAELARLLVAARPDETSRRRALQMVRDLELDAPADPEVLDAMGSVQLEVAGDAQRARVLFEAAAKLAPDQPRIRYHLATADLKLGKAEAARGEVRAALQSGRPFDQEPEARQLLRELGDTAR